MPASPVQRLLAGGIDILLVGGICGFLPISLVGKLTCAGLVLAALVVLQAVMGVGPGGAVMGMRLHRVSRGGNSPGLAALGRAGLIAVAAVATLGIVPVIMVVRADATGLRRTWFDRISGTMLVSRRSHTMYTLVLDGRSVAPGARSRAEPRARGCAIGLRTLRRRDGLQDARAARTHSGGHLGDRSRLDERHVPGRFPWQPRTGSWNGRDSAQGRGYILRRGRVSCSVAYPASRRRAPDTLGKRYRVAA